MDTVPAYVDWAGLADYKFRQNSRHGLPGKLFFVPEAEFLEVIGTSLKRIFLLAFHSRLY